MSRSKILYGRPVGNLTIGRRFTLLERAKIRKGKLSEVIAKAEKFKREEIQLLSKEDMYSGKERR